MERITELQRATVPGPQADTLLIIGELVNEQAPSRLDEDTADIKIGAFLDTVDDLPAWTLRAAIRRWRRGEAGGDRSELNFGLKPHRLREIALGLRAVADGQLIRLQRILEAEPFDPLTEEERGLTQQRIAREVRPQGMSGETSTSAAAAERAEAAADLQARLDAQPTDSTPQESVA